MSETRLTRSSSDRIVAGVCGGLADYLQIDSVFVRLAFLVLLFASGIGLPIYIILWIIMPDSDGSTDHGSEGFQKSIDELGETVQTEVGRIGRTGTIGIILMLLGGYFLLSEIGMLNWISGAIFWPLVLIGIGIYLLVKWNRNRA